MDVRRTSRFVLLMFMLVLKLITRSFFIHNGGRQDEKNQCFFFSLCVMYVCVFTGTYAALIARGEGQHKKNVYLCSFSMFCFCVFCFF